jgi:HK97 gp10 family phage protein
MPIKARIQGRDIVMRRLNGLAPKATVAAATAIEVGVKELAETIKSRSPVASGEYRNSIIAAKLSGRNDSRKPIGITATKDPNAWGIFADFLWRFLEFGTRPHTIKAKNTSDLVFFSKGNKIVTPQVAHPGTSPQPHIFNTYREMRKRIRRRIATAINKALKNRDV